jgi:hypothetical protein
MLLRRMNGLKRMNVNVFVARRLREKQLEINLGAGNGEAAAKQTEPLSEEIAIVSIIVKAEDNPTKAIFCCCGCR